AGGRRRRDARREGGLQGDAPRDDPPPHRRPRDPCRALLLGAPRRGSARRLPGRRLATMAAPDVTDLLIDLQEGREGALDQLIPLVYAELRSLAAAYLDRDANTPTLQPTALVHELYFKLVDQRRASWQNRAHFFGPAALLMRRLIVDHARRRTADK